MEIAPLQAEAVEPFIDELWLPAQREMAAMSEHTLADDIRDDGVSHRYSRLSDDETVTYLARCERQLIGYVAAVVRTPPPIFQQAKKCNINELFVREDARRRGVAAELLGVIEDWARTRDCDRLDLNVHRENRAAKELYEKEGYDVTRYNMKKRIEGGN